MQLLCQTNNLSRLTRPQDVSGDLDSACEQNGNVPSVKSVNDSRSGAEQTEAEGTDERDTDRVSVREGEEYFLDFIDSY